MYKCVGEIIEKRETFKEKEVHWKIPDFLSLSRLFFYDAPVFEFLNTRWHLQVNPCDSTSRLALQLKTDDEDSSYNMLCTLGFENNDGSLAVSSSFYHTFCDSKFKCIMKFFHRNELFERLPKLMMPSYVLTIICKLKHLDNTMHLTELKILSENIEHLFISKEFSDMTLHSKDQKFKVHKFVLAARSPVFAIMFKNEASEKVVDTLKIPDYDPDLFQDFLKYLYSSKLKISSLDSAFQLYQIACQYDVKGLKTFCVEYMLQNLNFQNVSDVTAFAEKYNESDLHISAMFSLCKLRGPDVLES